MKPLAMLFLTAALALTSCRSVTGPDVAGLERGTDALKKQSTADALVPHFNVTGVVHGKDVVITAKHVKGSPPMRPTDWYVFLQVDTDQAWNSFDFLFGTRHGDGVYRQLGDGFSTELVGHARFKLTSEGFRLTIPLSVLSDCPECEILEHPAMVAEITIGITATPGAGDGFGVRFPIVGVDAPDLVAEAG